MIRLFGVHLPSKKKVRAGLPYIYGIGKNNVFDLCKALGIDPESRMYELSDDSLNSIRVYVEENLKVEGDLRAEKSSNIKRLVAIGCYRGRMHKSGLPVRGQRTKTNARTRKGPKKSFGKK
ncbi:MAG: 30S ribosomal protein S13 [Alphaproteobacteria bacterium]|nr:30S ribosomal protein S13 [Rickettsiales bacterium]